MMRGMHKPHGAFGRSCCPCVWCIPAWVSKLIDPWCDDRQWSSLLYLVVQTFDLVPVVGSQKAFDYQKPKTMKTNHP